MDTRVTRRTLLRSAPLRLAPSRLIPGRIAPARSARLRSASRRLMTLALCSVGVSSPASNRNRTTLLLRVGSSLSSVVSVYARASAVGPCAASAGALRKQGVGVLSGRYTPATLRPVRADSQALARVVDGGLRSLTHAVGGAYLPLAHVVLPSLGSHYRFLCAL